MNNNTYIEEDEIDLKELWTILVQRKKFIVIFTIIITIGAILFALLKTPIYEVTSNVQIGHIGKDLIAKPEVLAKKIEVYFEAMDLKENKDNLEVGIVSSISQAKKLKDFITIKTEATSNELALQRNKEVVKYIQNLYLSKIEQIKIDTKNNIETIKRNISNIDNFEKRNILRQIEVIKKQKMVKIDEEIERLKLQDIPKIDEQIKFIKNKKISQIDAKINFNKNNLLKYNKSVNDIYKQTKDKKDTTLLTVSSLQMTNYQNLILNAQNKIEDLKLDKEKLLSETIKDLELKKKNIIDVNIANLIRDKSNIQDDTIRKLQYKLDIDLPAKKIKLEEQIQKLNFNISEQSLQNSKVVGDYLVYDYAIKPKKKLIVVVAFVTGLILSIFIAFFLNFIGKKD